MNLSQIDFIYKFASADADIRIQVLKLLIESQLQRVSLAEPERTDYEAEVQVTNPCR